MHTIAVDAHSANCSFAIFNERGQLAQCLERPTSAAQLIEVVASVRGPKRLIVEESHMAQWIKRTAERYVDRLIVCDPQRNAWIAKDEFNDDRSSALKLGRLLFGGFIKEIRHPDDAGAQLRTLFLHYHDLNEQITRFKNKLKAVFRQEAIGTRRGLYEEEAHRVWLRKLAGQPHRQHQARHLFELVDSLEALKQETHAAMLKRARMQPGFAWLTTIPGVGDVLATGYIALIDTPHRFSRRNKLWKYAGLGVRRHTSDGNVYEAGSGASGNRPLKWVVYTHFNGAVERTKSANRFKRQYETLQQRGLPWETARRQVCRALLSTVWAVWIKEEPYRDEPLKRSS